MPSSTAPSIDSPARNQAGPRLGSSVSMPSPAASIRSVSASDTSSSASTCGSESLSVGQIDRTADCASVSWSAASTGDPTIPTLPMSRLTATASRSEPANGTEPGSTSPARRGSTNAVGPTAPPGLVSSRSGGTGGRTVRRRPGRAVRASGRGPPAHSGVKPAPMALARPIRKLALTSSPPTSPRTRMRPSRGSTPTASSRSNAKGCSHFDRVSWRTSSGRHPSRPGTPTRSAASLRPAAAASRPAPTRRLGFTSSSDVSRVDPSSRTWKERAPASVAMSSAGRKAIAPRPPTRNTTSDGGRGGGPTTSRSSALKRTSPSAGGFGPRRSSGAVVQARAPGSSRSSRGAVRSAHASASTASPSARAQSAPGRSASNGRGGSSAHAGRFRVRSTRHAAASSAPSRDAPPTSTSPAAVLTSRPAERRCRLRTKCGRHCPASGPVSPIDQRSRAISPSRSPSPSVPHSPPCT